MSGRIVVVGDVMTDIIVRPHGPLVPGSDRAATIRDTPGGSGANQAAWLGHLGAEVSFAGRVGAAAHATHAAELRGFGVIPHLAADPALPSGRIVTLLDAQGERSFLTDRGANAALCHADLPEWLLDGAAHLHVSGYSLFLDGPRAAVRAFMAAAWRRSLTVSLDAASAGFIAECGAAAFLSWSRGCLLFANSDEAMALTGSPDPRMQLARLTTDHRLVVVKRGALGACAMAQDEPMVEAPAPAAEVVDTTGAGDAFLAGFLLAWRSGRTLADCLAAGTALGAEATRQLGGRPPAQPAQTTV